MLVFIFSLLFSIFLSFFHILSFWSPLWKISSALCSSSSAILYIFLLSRFWGLRTLLHSGCYFCSKQFLFCGCNIFSYLNMFSYQHKVFTYQHSSQSDPFKICHIMSFLLKSHSSSTSDSQEKPASLQCDGAQHSLPLTSLSSAALPLVHSASATPAFSVLLDFSEPAPNLEPWL